MQKNKKAYEKTIWRDGETIISADLLNKVEDKLVDLDSQITDVEHENQRQNFYINALYNENIDGRLTAEEENSNDIKLESSKQGLVEVEKVVGNTLVNRVSEQMRELTLNGNIDAEGTFVTTTEGVDNGLVDIVCEGNTLVNLIKLDTSEYQTIKPSSIHLLALGSANLFQNGKQYTIICEFADIVGNAKVCFNFNSGGSAPDIRVKPTQGLVKHTFTMPTEPIIKTNAQVKAYYFDRENSCKIKNLMILEGDWTNKEISYFEGMKSVGERTDGNHKIEILSQNKNWYNNDDFNNPDGNWTSSGGGTKKVEYDNIEKAFYTQQHRRRLVTGLKPNTKYTVSVDMKLNGDKKGDFQFLFKTPENLGGDVTNEWKRFNIVITSSEDGMISWVAYSKLYWKDIQIEEGTQATYYVPHTSNKKEISLNEPLRGIPNGSKDRFVKRDGKWFIERNIGIANITSAMNWRISGRQFEDHSSFFTNIDSQKDGSRYLSISCPYIRDAYTNKLDIECISTNILYSDKLFIFNIKRNKLKTDNVEGLRKYLTENPFEVLYELAKPVYEPLETALELTCYNEATHISNNSLIPSNMVVKNTGFSCRALTSGETYTVVHNGGEEVTSRVDTVDNMVRLSGKGKKVSDIMVLDGEVSKTYGSFEGMQSTFEDKLVTQEMVDDGLEKAENLGKYKVGVTVRGKNLKNLNTVNQDWGGGLFNTTISQNNLNYHSCETFDVSDLRGKTIYARAFRNRKPCYTTFFICIFDKNKKQIGNRYELGQHEGYKVPDNAYYMRFMFNCGNNNSLEAVKTDKYAIAIEPFTTGETYEPCKEYKTSVYLNSPLLKGDEIVMKEDGLYHYHKMWRMNLKEATTSNTKWNVNGSLITSFWSNTLKHDKDKSYIKITTNTICDKITDIRQANAINITFKEGELSSNDDVGVKAWVEANNPTVIYELAEPYYEKISDNKFITETPNNATLHIDSTIPCQSVKVSYTGNVPSVYGLEETGITNTNDIAATQTAVDFLLMSSMGEVMMMSFKNNTKGSNNMGAYFASRIMKKALKYEDVIRKYQEFKEDIDFILRSEGYGDLIVEVQ